MLISHIGQRKGFDCATTGKNWSDGYYVSRTGKFHYLQNPIPIKGFMGYRKIDDNHLCDMNKDKIILFPAIPLDEAAMSEQTPLLEKARVGFINGQFEVYVHTDDGGNIPHVHVRDAETQGKKFETCISLLKSEYFLHGKYKDKISTSIANEFADFMESPSRNKRYNTNYEYAVDMWNDNNSNVNITPKYDENGNVIIPNYRNLNK